MNDYKNMKEKEDHPSIFSQILILIAICIFIISICFLACYNAQNTTNIGVSNVK